MIKKATPPPESTANEESILRLAPKCVENAASLFTAFVECDDTLAELKARASKAENDDFSAQIKKAVANNGVSISDVTAKKLTQRVDFSAFSTRIFGQLITTLGVSGTLSDKEMFSFVGDISAANVLFVCALIAIGDAISAERAAAEVVSHDE